MSIANGRIVRRRVGAGAGRPRMVAVVLPLLLLLAICAGCGNATTPGAQGDYGGALNHVHDLLALDGVPNVVLLATHVALYRSSDDGRTWSQVAGGSSQPMAGLMLYKLAQSPVDPQRVYLLAIERQAGLAADTPGLYQSDDAGQTWRLATALSALPSQAVYTIGTGALGPGQVFALLTSLQANALYASNDAGSHWTALPALPTTAPTGVAGDTLTPAHLFLWSIADGLFESGDSGRTWQSAPGIVGGIFSVALARRTIYASGDQGLFVSTDNGARFTLVESAYTFTRVVACPSAANHAYALVGTAVYTTNDGGQMWTRAAPTSSHPTLLADDPTDPASAFVAFSYPVGVQTTRDAGSQWQTLMP